ncbi:WXG100 family type VII secretion target [Leucobacter denitrificans]|uniref:WXG100 family type VII secretion target n=1 Tax=Leucobacter denitrificans TaxID=683042 RepID=A0A7G9S4D6_9MICO|nr:WXG100 family type VII secretion target [Leucobacter denitrificans]QNN62711.1 WXG100 family type VII secretion target [Leucobacter denitrificans]
MTTFRVRAASLGEVSAQLQGVLAVFDAHVASVTSKVNAVSGVSWEGEDQVAFAERFATWQETADLVRMSLTTLSMQLNGAEGAYTQLEAGVRGRMLQGKQNQAPLLEVAEDIEEAVDTGLERSRTAEKKPVGGAVVGGSVTARTGRGEAGQGEKVSLASATAQPTQVPAGETA